VTRDVAGFSATMLAAMAILTVGAMGGG
jgi:hypothetical protein